jgi:type III secretion protein Q
MPPGMHEETTYVGPPSAPARRQLPGARRLRLAPLKKLTRAHLALQRRPQVAAEGREALGAIAEHLSTQLGTAVGLEARLADAALHPVTQLQQRGAFAVLELAGDALAVLELEPVALGALLQHAAGSAPAQAGPVALTRIEEAALGWLTLSALAAVRALPAVQARWAPRLVAVYQDRRQVLEHVDARRRHVAAQVLVRLGDQSGLARLLVPASWLQAMASALPEDAAGPMAPEIAAAGLEVVPRLGTVALTRTQARAVRTGDVLVFPGVTSASGQLQGPGRLLGPSFEALGAFGPAGLTLTRAFERLPKETAVPASDPAVPVEVEIELTRLRLPLHELGALQPGAVVRLHLDASQTVILRVGDRAVARAELVDVEGEVGARILQLLGKAS